MTTLFNKASLAVLLLLLCNICMAQTPPLNADSLRRLIAAERVDTVKARQLIRLTEALRAADSAGAMQAAAQALAIYTKHGPNAGVAQARFVTGRVYHYYDNYEAAGIQYQEGLDAIGKDSGLPVLHLRAKLTGNLAAVYGVKGQVEKELEMTLSIIPMLERVKDTLALAVASFNVGVKFYNGEQYKKAYSYLQKSIALHEKRPSAQLTEAYLIITYCAMNLDSLEAMRRYLDKADKIIDHSDPRLEEEYEVALGQYHFKTKNYPEAEKAYLRALQVKSPSNALPLSRTNALESLNEVYQARGRYAEARKVMQEYMSISRGINWQANILHGLNILSKLEEKTHNYAAALRYLREYNHLGDSVKREESKVQLHNLEMKYQASEKEKKILELEGNSRQQQLVLQRSRAYNALLLAGLIVALLVALIIFIIYRNKHRLAAQREQLQRQELENMKQAQRIQHFSAMLEGQEQERRRLARDLHDGLGGTMASIRVKAADLADSATPNDAQMKQIITQLDGATRELRRIAHNMMPEALLKFGLEAALKDLCESLQHNGAAIVFQAFDLRGDIPQSQQIMIYRLVQELLGNALKHSGARNILVQCLQRGEELSVIVEDDGKGFDQGSLSPADGIGLQSVRARVDYLKGRLDIQSTPGVGTTVNIDIHVQETAPDIAAYS
ncbi:ATP-binding protein [Chitinophaga sp. YIM B06452]|uniref:tetratricopeptide repeat-containing sensor histidine kinase n=1 Tax=Chitinophaga sp. YIM B06452 TaxID=3082158 RepID=UPI0031FE6F70